MKPGECPREQETLRLALSRRWPDCADAELRSHVAECQACGEVVAVAALLGTERDEALRDAQVPAAGQIWWRAALRAHAEAVATARRPLVWLHGIAAACAVGLIAALVTLAWPAISSAAAALAALRPDVAPLVETLRPVMPLAIVVLACLIVTPIVVYLALSDD